MLSRPSDDAVFSFCDGKKLRTGLVVTFKKHLPCCHGNNRSPAVPGAADGSEGFGLGPLTMEVGAASETDEAAGRGRPTCLGQALFPQTRSGPQLCCLQDIGFPVASVSCLSSEWKEISVVVSVFPESLRVFRDWQDRPEHS